MVVCIGILVATAIGLAPFNRSYAIPSRASIKAIKLGIYWDAQLSNRTEYINWGMLEPGGNKSVLLYVQNQANTEVTLGMYPTSWDPVNASDFIALQWNYTGALLQIDEVILVELTIMVDPSIIGITSFLFDIVMQAVG